MHYSIAMICYAQLLNHEPGTSDIAALSFVLKVSSNSRRACI